MSRLERGAKPQPHRRCARSFRLAHELRNQRLEAGIAAQRIESLVDLHLEPARN